MSIFGGIPIRPIARMDTDDLLVHLQALSEEDRMLRFCSNPTDEALVKYVDKVKFRLANHEDEIFGHYSSSGVLVGVSHVCVDTDVALKKFAEIGISVLPQGRGKGVAKALMNRSILHAENLRCVRVETMCLMTNAKMDMLAKSVGMTVKTEDKEKKAELELPCPNASTIQREAVLNHLGIWDNVIEERLIQSNEMISLLCFRMAFPLTIFMGHE